jgi:hypothetical protein
MANLAGRNWQFATSTYWAPGWVYFSHYRLFRLSLPALMQRRTCCAQFGDEYNACCSHAWRLIPELYYQIRTGKVALFDGSWIAPAARKVGSGKYAKWLLFHLHQLQKFAQQNMH